MTLFSQVAGNQAASELTAEQFEEYVFVEHTNKVFFNRRGTFVGPKGSDKPIIEFNQLGKEPGDAITIPLRMALSGAGKFGDQELWGSEEAYVARNMRVYINQLRHGTGTEGRMSRQRVAFDSDVQAARALGEWLARQRDNYVFEAIYRLHPDHVVAATGSGGLGLSQVVHPNWLVAGSASIDGYDSSPANEAAIQAEEALLTGAADEVMSAELLDIIAAQAEVNNFMPIMIDGEPRYILIIHPYQAKQLREDTDWAQAQQNANVRGSQNPMFRGAIGEWNNLVVYKSNKVEVSPGDADVRRAILLAGNACASAMSGGAFTDRETWDYGNQHRYMAGMVFGYRRADWYEQGASDPFNQSSMIISTYSPAV